MLTLLPQVRAMHKQPFGMNLPEERTFSEL